MKTKIFFFISILTLFFFISILNAETKCKSKDVVDAVDKAVSILEKDGEPGLKKIKKIRFCGNNYVFVNDFEGRTLMHIKPHLIGRILIHLKDDKGKRFFVNFTRTAKKTTATKNGKTYYAGSGWVKYRWPKPGGDKKKFFDKKSYIKGCLMGNKNVYVGAGIYE